MHGKRHQRKGLDMAQKAPGKAHRKGISLMEVAEMFATEEKAVEWFESWYWPTGEIACMLCGSLNAYRVKSGKPMPYRCKDCRKYFSLKKGTAMEKSPLPLRKWGWAIYLELTNLKGVSAMKLHRDLDVSYPTAWFMLHRIREAFADVTATFEGPGRSGRDLRWRTAEEHEHGEAEGTGALGSGSCGQAARRGDEGPEDGPCRRTGHRQHGR